MKIPKVRLDGSHPRHALVGQQQSWIDWRARTIANSMQDTTKDVLLRESYVINAMLNTVTSAACSHLPHCQNQCRYVKKTLMFLTSRPKFKSKV